MTPLKFENGFWWPSTETHMNVYGSSYQVKVRDMAIARCETRELALDIGAHVGIASRHFSNNFKNVISFEPVSTHFRALCKNIAGIRNVFPINLACSEATGELVTLYDGLEGNSGNCIPEEYTGGFIDPKEHTCHTFRIDDMYVTPSLIKVDVEGFEPLVIKGARYTIERCHPVIMVEAKALGYSRKDPLEAVKLLESMGYTIDEQVSHDYIMTYKGAK